MSQKLRKLQCFFAYTCHLLSSLIIFNPLYRSSNPVLSLFAFLVTGIVFTSAIIFLYPKIKTKQLYAPIYSFFCIICCALSVFVSLILLTEVIKQTCYIANKNISMLYYTLFTLFVLAVSFYLCCSGFKGIYRFSIIICCFFALLIIVLPTVFISTKGVIIKELLPKIENNIFKDIFTGFKAGVFTCFDTIVFIFCFEEYIKDKSGKLYTRIFLSSFFVCFAFFTIILTILITTFGKEILRQLEYPVYSLLKLVYAFDAVDLLSFTLIPAYMIKSSVFIYTCSTCLNKALSKQKDNTKRIIGILHLSIPLILIIVAIFFKNLGFGAFQHAIYSLNAILCSIFTFLVTQKKK